jgi:hypothetical protein
MYALASSGGRGRGRGATGRHARSDKGKERKGKERKGKQRPRRQGAGLAGRPDTGRAQRYCGVCFLLPIDQGWVWPPPHPARRRPCPAPACSALLLREGTAFRRAPGADRGERSRVMSRPCRPWQGALPAGAWYVPGTLLDRALARGHGRVKIYIWE